MEAKTSTDSAATAAPRAVLQAWEHAVNAGDGAGALACYADDALLHPTYRPGWNRGREAISSYFAMLGSRPGVGVIFDRCEVMMLGEDAAVADGHYAFRWLDGDDRIKDAARFTFVLARIDGDWRIVSHHSSAMPG